MRILFLSNRGLLPVRDGHTRRSFNILKGLAEVNEVHLLSLYESPEEVMPANVEALKSMCERVELVPSPPKTLSVGLVARLLRSLVSADAYTVWRHYSSLFKDRVRELVSTGRFDLVHCDILPLCYTVRGIQGVLRCVTDHDVSYLKCLRMGSESGNPLLKAFLFLEAAKLKRLESTLFAQVDLGIAVSDLDRDILQGLCPQGRFAVIENGVEPDAFRRADEPELANRLVWLGGFDHHPNREGVRYFLERIYPLVKEKEPRVCMDIVGGGVTTELKRSAARDPSLCLTGYVDDPMLYLRRASVFVAPILSGGGTKLKVLEAMAAGKAIVCTSIGCEGINGSHGVHFLVADDERNFAKSIVVLFHDDSLRAELGANARALARREHDYRAICSKLNGLYRDIVRPLSNFKSIEST